MTLILSILILAILHVKEILIINSEIVIIVAFFILLFTLISNLSQSVNAIFKSHSDDILDQYKKILDNQTISNLTQKTYLELLILEIKYLTDLQFTDHFAQAQEKILIELHEKTSKNCDKLLDQLFILPKTMKQ